MTLKEAAQTAIYIQDAVNLHAILVAWNDIREKILRDILHKEGTKAFNEHPINVMFASKVASLTQCEDGPSCSKAYDACKKLAND